MGGIKLDILLKSFEELLEGEDPDVEAQLRSAFEEAVGKDGELSKEEWEGLAGSEEFQSLFEDHYAGREHEGEALRERLSQITGEAVKGANPTFIRRVSQFFKVGPVQELRLELPLVTRESRLREVAGGMGELLAQRMPLLGDGQGGINRWLIRAPSYESFMHHFVGDFANRDQLNYKSEYLALMGDTRYEPLFRLVYAGVEEFLKELELPVSLYGVRSVEELTELYEEFKLKWVAVDAAERVTHLDRK